MIHFSVLGILMVKLDNIFLLLSSFYSFKINTSLTMKSRFEGYGVFGTIYAFILSVF
jgi:hypothetical protein